MKYTITISQTEEKKVIESVYISDEELQSRGENKGEKKSNYRDVETTKSVTSELYKQSTTGEIDLKTIIDAFNK